MHSRFSAKMDHLMINTSGKWRSCPGPTICSSAQV